jgi:hypothetical protein
MRQLNRNTASGAEAAELHKVQPVKHSGVQKPDDSSFLNFLFKQNVQPRGGEPKSKRIKRLHTPGCTPRKCLVSRFRDLRKRYTFHDNQNQNFSRKVFREFCGIPENAQKRPKKGEFHGILKWWKIHSHAVRGLRISGFLRTPQNGPF